MHRRHCLFSIASIVLVAGLSAGNSARGATIGSPQLVGTITSSALNEVSGLVGSRSLTDVFWVHNDSGDSARFFAMSRLGDLLGTFPLSGAPAGDWEDIALGPKSGGGSYLYLGDIGDNNARRSNITVYRTDEPQATTGAAITSDNYRALRLQYPDGPRDAESMFVDPHSGDLFILTKRLSTPELYQVPAAAFDDVSQPFTMTRVGGFSNVPFWATAADVSPDGRFILVRSGLSSTGRLFERTIGQSIAEALATNSVAFPLGNEAQGEAIGWAADGKQFFTTSEFAGGSSAPIHAYSFRAPPTLPGDYNNDHVVDAADYSVWRNLFGQEVELPNESETLGVVTSEDYGVWKANYGQSLSGSGAGIAQAETAPEPCTSLMAICAGLLLVQSRRGEFRRR